MHGVLETCINFLSSKDEPFNSFNSLVIILYTFRNVPIPNIKSSNISRAQIKL